MLLSSMLLVVPWLARLAPPGTTPVATVMCSAAGAPEAAAAVVVPAADAAIAPCRGVADEGAGDAC